MDDWQTECSKCWELIDVKDKTCGYCGEPQFRPCPSCATFRAKLDREKLARVMLGTDKWTSGWLAGRFADAIIAYLKEG